MMDVIADVGGTEFRERMLPGSMSDLVQQGAQLGPLLSRAPRHMDRIATLLEHGRLTMRLRLFTDVHEVRVLEHLVNRIVLALLQHRSWPCLGIAAENRRWPSARSDRRRPV